MIMARPNDALIKANAAPERRSGNARMIAMQNIANLLKKEMIIPTLRLEMLRCTAHDIGHKIGA